MKILIIAAHPDDEILGCGGLLSKYYTEEKMLITLTDGVSSRNDENLINRNIITNEVCRFFNILHFIYGNFPDNRLDSVDLIDIIKFIENSIHNFIPDIILTHYPNCLNIDHQLTYRATITCFRPQVYKSIKILSFYIPSSTDYNPLNNLISNYYVKLELCDVEKKLECLKLFYDKEMRVYPHSRSYKNIKNLTKVWGSEIGTLYAEKYLIIRIIE
jgi:LmbE family N-acetylglucosaminyl deacetylase